MPEALNHGAHKAQHHGFRQRHVADADQEENKDDGDRPFRSWQHSFQKRSSNREQQIKKKQQAMAAVPGKNSGEQAESASGTNKKHERYGSTRNSGHFLSNTSYQDAQLLLNFQPKTGGQQEDFGNCTPVEVKTGCQV